MCVHLTDAGHSLKRKAAGLKSIEFGPLGKRITAHRQPRSQRNMIAPASISRFKKNVSRALTDEDCDLFIAEKIMASRSGQRKSKRP